MPIIFAITDGAVNFDKNNNSLLVNHISASASEPDIFTVDNKPGVALPSTGGSGTAPYTLAGIALMALAGIALVKRKRKANQ